jgi:hypothetical protein
VVPSGGDAKPRELAVKEESPAPRRDGRRAWRDLRDITPFRLVHGKYSSIILVLVIFSNGCHAGLGSALSQVAEPPAGAAGAVAAAVGEGPRGRGAVRGAGAGQGRRPRGRGGRRSGDRGREAGGRGGGGRRRVVGGPPPVTTRACCSPTTRAPRASRRR